MYLSGKLGAHDEITPRRRRRRRFVLLIRRGAVGAVFLPHHEKNAEEVSLRLFSFALCKLRIMSVIQEGNSGLPENSADLRNGRRRRAVHKKPSVPASARSRGRRRARSRSGTPGARERRPVRATRTARRSFGTSVTMGQIQKYNNCVRRPALQRRPSPSCSCDALRRAVG